jgi:tellurite resistance protein TerB
MANIDGTDGMAYAQATWARFDEEIGDELLRAVCGAFALVSAADGSVSSSEIDRFAGVLEESAERFPNLDLAKIDGLFRQLGQAILSDPEDGRQRVLREVAAVSDDEKKRDLVRAAALIAIEADGRTLESEETVLTDIAGALGL